MGRERWVVGSGSRSCTCWVKKMVEVYGKTYFALLTEVAVANRRVVCNLFLCYTTFSLKIRKTNFKRNRMPCQALRTALTFRTRLTMRSDLPLASAGEAICKWHKKRRRLEIQLVKAPGGRYGCHPLWETYEDIGFWENLGALWGYFFGVYLYS